MHTCIHAYMHTCIHAYMQTYLPTYLPTYLRPTDIQTYRPAYLPTWLHDYMTTWDAIHPSVPPSIDTHIMTCTHKHIHAGHAGISLGHQYHYWYIILLVYDPLESSRFSWWSDGRSWSLGTASVCCKAPGHRASVYGTGSMWPQWFVQAAKAGHRDLPWPDPDLAT